MPFPATLRCALLACLAAGCSSPSDPLPPAGSPDAGTSTLPSTTATAITSGASHTCALTASGAIRCWGYNAYGQLGDGAALGSTDPVLAPIEVARLGTGNKAVSSQNEHTCALTRAGGVACWGRNHYGQLGNGTTTDSSTPVDVTGLASGVTAIATGAEHSCAVTAAGGVKCWGANESGRLGNGPPEGTMVTTPVDVHGLGAAVSSIAAGSSHTCAVLADGMLACWGNNANSALGTGTERSQEYGAVIVPGVSAVTAVTASYHQTCAVAGGAVKCWGLNGKGQVGNGEIGGNVGNVDAPTTVVGLTSGATAVSAGLEYACAVVSGAVTCWGHNGDGMLGDHSRDPRTSPVPVTGLSRDNIGVAASVHHTCSLGKSGAVTCWGSNVAGVLGDPSAPIGVMAPAPVGVVSLP